VREHVVTGSDEAAELKSSKQLHEASKAFGKELQLTRPIHSDKKCVADVNPIFNQITPIYPIGELGQNIDH